MTHQESGARGGRKTLRKYGKKHFRMLAEKSNAVQRVKRAQRTK